MRGGGREGHDDDVKKSGALAGCVPRTRHDTVDLGSEWCYVKRVAVSDMAL